MSIARYRRERWVTPDGRTVKSPLPQGLCGHFGPELVRFVILQHVQGQVTTERLTAMLNEIGIVISKRQILRIINNDPGSLNSEATELFRAGLESADWITVDDTGARHGAKNGYTTQIGDHIDSPTLMTTFSKSRAFSCSSHFVPPLRRFLFSRTVCSMTTPSATCANMR
ncbi:MAG: transposase [Geminicoccaceae bacterium]